MLDVEAIITHVQRHQTMCGCMLDAKHNAAQVRCTDGQM
jgi:hypothetical protein